MTPYDIYELTGDSVVKNLLPMQHAPIRYLGGEDALKKEMATHSSILAWEIPWTEEPTTRGVSRVGHNLVTKPPSVFTCRAHFSAFRMF